VQFAAFPVHGQGNFDKVAKPGREACQRRVIPRGVRVQAGADGQGRCRNEAPNSCNRL
jgi:hypothetical protein